MPFRWFDSKKLPKTLHWQPAGNTADAPRRRLGTAVRAAAAVVLASLGVGSVYVAYVTWLYANADVIVTVSAAPAAVNMRDVDLDDLANRAGNGARRRALDISERFSDFRPSTFAGMTDFETDGTYCAMRSYYDLGLAEQVLAVSGSGPIIVSEETLNRAVIRSGAVPELIAEIAGIVRWAFDLPYKRLAVVIDERDDVGLLRFTLEHYRDLDDGNGWQSAEMSDEIRIGPRSDVEGALEALFLRTSYPALSAIGIPHRGTKAMGVETFLASSLPPASEALVHLGAVQALEYDGQLNQASTIKKAFERTRLLIKASNAIGAARTASDSSTARSDWTRVWAVANLETVIQTVNRNRWLVSSGGVSPLDLISPDSVYSDTIYSIAVGSGIAQAPELTGDRKTNFEAALSALEAAHLAYATEMGTAFLLSLDPAAKSVVDAAMSDSSALASAPENWATDANAVLPLEFLLLDGQLREIGRLYDGIEDRTAEWAARQVSLLDAMKRMDHYDRLTRQLRHQDPEETELILGAHLLSILNGTMYMLRAAPTEQEPQAEQLATEARRLLKAYGHTLHPTFASHLEVALSLRVALQSGQHAVVASLVREFDDYPVCIAANLLGVFHDRRSAWEDDRVLTGHYIATASRLIDRGLRNFALFNSLASALHSTKDFEGALTAFRNARAYSEGSLEWSYSNESMVLLEMGRFDAAATRARQALQGGHSFVAGRSNLLNALFFTKDTIGYARAVADIYSEFEDDRLLTLQDMAAIRSYGPELVRDSLGLLKCLTGVDPSQVLLDAGQPDLVPRPTMSDCINADIRYEKALINTVWERRSLRAAIADLDALKISDAELKLTSVIAAEPGNAFAYMLRGSARADLRMIDSAISDLTSAINLGGTWPGAYRVRALMLGAAGRFDEATADLERAVAESDAPHVQGLGSMLILQAQKDYGAVLATLEEVEADFDQDPAYWVARAEALTNLARLDDAGMAFNRAAALTSDDATLWYRAGNANYTLGRYEAAVTFYSLAIEAGPDRARYRNNRGNSYRYLGLRDEAMADYERALELDQTHVFANNGRANILFDWKRYDEALTAYDRAIELDPAYVIARTNRANTLRRLKRFEEALAEYSRAIELDANNGNIYNARGNVYYNKERYQEAIADFEHAMRHNPDDVRPISSRGNALTKLGRYDEAIADLEAAIEMEPDLSIYYNNLAWVLATGPDAIRDPQRALALAERSVALASPPQAYHFGTYGAALVAAGRTDAAIEQYEKSINLDDTRARLYREDLVEKGYLAGPISDTREEALATAIHACVVDGCQLLAP